MPSRLIEIGLIDLEDRQREDYGDLAELAKSIDDPKIGLLQPIVVEEKGGRFKLRAGGRRLAAHLMLKRTQIEALVRGEMTSLEAQVIELEENVRRKDLEWQEKSKAVDRIHKLKMTTEKDWNVDKTAALVGFSRRHTYEFLELSQAIDKIPEVASAEKPHAAMNRLRQHKQLTARKEAVELQRVRVSRGEEPVRVEWHVHSGDSREYVKTMADGSVDMILTDPPWLVDYDKLLKGGKKGFDDSINVLPVVQTVLAECYRVLRNERFCVMYWPTNDTPIPVEVLKEYNIPAGTTLHQLGRWFLTSAGFRVWNRPIIWYKPNKSYGSIQDPSKEFNSKYETIFWAFKGDARFFKRPDSDVFVADSPTGDRLHPNEKSVPLSEVFVDICTVGGETVFDPFAGGGSHGEAGLRMERRVVVCELDPEFASRTSTRLESIAQRKSSGDIPKLGNMPQQSVEPGGTGPAPETAKPIVFPSPVRAKIAQTVSEGFDQDLFSKEEV